MNKFQHLRGSLAVGLLCALAVGCAAPLPVSAPFLSDLERPLRLAQEPNDEALRRELPLGSFSGVEVGAAEDTLEALTGGGEGLRVVRVIENSPAQAADLRPGDLLLEAAATGDAEFVELSWPSDWAELELLAEPGTQGVVVFDRAGRELETELTWAARVAPRTRAEVVTFEETAHVGVVLRSATEVEAHQAGLAPGAGAVVIGLSRRSPWRAAGITFEDLIVQVDGEPLAAPQELLDKIRETKPGRKLDLVVAGEAGLGPERSVRARVSSRERAFRRIHIPLLFSCERFGVGRSEWNFLLGLFRFERTPVAWRTRFLWWIDFERGDSERLVELSE